VLFAPVIVVGQGFFHRILEKSPQLHPYWLKFFDLIQVNMPDAPRIFKPAYSSLHNQTRATKPAPPKA
jgi:hypothetical protein